MVIKKVYKKNQLMIGSNGRKQKKHVFDWINLICLSLFAIASIYPLIYVIAGSFNEGSDYINGGVWLFPRVFSFGRRLGTPFRFGSSYTLFRLLWQRFQLRAASVATPD